MKYLVGIADMKIASGPGDLVVTHALGSCLGIAIHDPAANIGGILHVMLPSSQVNPEKAKANPFMFVDTGVPAFFRELEQAGAQRKRLRIKVAGGAEFCDKSDLFAIGKRNYVMLRKLLWKNGIMIHAEDVGGHVSRTMYLDIATGRTVIASAGQKRELA